jgi:hypothetical protein
MKKPHVLDYPLPKLEIDAMGTKRWWVNGQLHRIDGPAIEYSNGDKSYYQYGVLHREDGPAIDWESSTEWHYKGKYIPVDNLKEFQSFIRNKAFW